MERSLSKGLGGHCPLLTGVSVALLEKLVSCSGAVLLVKPSTAYSRLRKESESSICTPNVNSMETVLSEALASLILQERREGSTVRRQWRDCGRSSQAAFTKAWNQRVVFSTFR